MRQYTSAEQIAGFLNSRLSLTDSSSLGTTVAGASITVSSPPLTTNAGILPPSWAGDQLIFSVDQSCYRLLHIERLNQLWVAESSQCSALVNSQGLARGPNQQINGQWQFASDSDLYDPVLDRILANQGAPGGVSFFLLAEGIAGGDQQLFSYYDVGDNQIAVDQRAALGSSNPIYQGSLGTSSAASVFAVKLSITALGNPSRSSDNQAVKNRVVETTIYPNQLYLQESL